MEETGDGKGGEEEEEEGGELDLFPPSLLSSLGLAISF